MPTMKNRATRGAGKSAQVRRPTGGQPSNGVQKMDGTKNMNAGTARETKPWALDGKSVVIKTPV